MKINLNKKPSAVVLIVALFIIMASGIIVASYLTLMSNETRTVGRAQIWEKCIPVMEAGAEEAMAQIQACNGTTNLSTNSWTLNSTNYYQKTRYVGTNGSYCVVRIQPVNPPVIYSTAYVPIPDTTNFMTRTIKVNTTNGYGAGGLVAKGTITMSGNTQLDSYNSNIASYNPSSPGTNAIAKTLATTTSAINLGPKGSAHIFGTAVTGVGGSIGMGGGSYIGPPPIGSAATAGYNGIAPGWTNNDANFQINSNSPPNTSGWYTSTTLPNGGNIVSVVTNLTTNLLSGLTSIVSSISNTTNYYTYLYTTGNYRLDNSVYLTGIQSMAITGQVKLYVTGSFTVDSSAYVYIAPNSSLTLYLGGNLSLGGAGLINTNKLPSAFTVYAMNSCTNVTEGNGTAFYGSIFAPNAAVSVSGAGDFYGQITGNTINISGGGSVHYDQALGGDQFFNAFCWNEL